MRTGISTACLYPMPLEDSFSTLVSMNFRNFEVFINTCSELRESYLKKLKKTADESGSSIPLLPGTKIFSFFRNTADALTTAWIFIKTT